MAREEQVVVYRLKEKSKTGYVLRRKTNQETIGSIREFSKGILGAYADSKTRKQSSDKYILGKVWSDSYAFSKEMCEILEEKYFKKVDAQKINKLGIKDLEYAETVIRLKDDEYSVRKMLEIFMKQKNIDQYFWYELYTEKMKEKMLEPDEIDKEYYYLTVVYVDIGDYYSQYNYISEDESIMPKDKVVVDRAGNITVGLVINARKYSALEAPFPVKSTKRVIRKIENDDELDDYDLDTADFEDAYYEYFENDEEDDDDDDEGCGYSMFRHSYRRITTFSEDKNAIAKISVELIEKKLAASTHTDKVVSSYWWKDKVVDTEEYRLEIITREDKVDEVVKTIKQKHNYEVPEIQVDNHNTLNPDIEKWIDDIVDQSNDLTRSIPETLENID